MTLSELNNLLAEPVRELLLDCCGSQTWANQMIARRPFHGVAELHGTAEDVWRSLDQNDWLEAFSKHPKIGDTNGAGAWSSEEQSGMSEATSDMAEAMLKLNRSYEERFGWIFIVCASGKSADEMCALLEAAPLK